MLARKYACIIPEKRPNDTSMFFLHFYDPQRQQVITSASFSRGLLSIKQVSSRYNELTNDGRLLYELKKKNTEEDCAHTLSRPIAILLGRKNSLRKFRLYFCPAFPLTNQNAITYQRLLSSNKIDFSLLQSISTYFWSHLPSVPLFILIYFSLRMHTETILFSLFERE